MVLFSDFSSIQNDLITQEPFINALRNYSFVAKPLIEPVIDNTGIRNLNRPSFITPDGALTINVLTNKTLIEYLNRDIYVVNPITMSDFIKEITDILSKVSLFSGASYKRIGLVRQTLIDEIDQQLVFNCFCRGINFYKNLKMTDWNVFFPAKKETANGKIINVTSRISHLVAPMKINSSIKQFDGVSIVTDVNTLSTNRIDNLSWNDIESIIRELQKTEYEITNQTINAIETIDK